MTAAIAGVALHWESFSLQVMFAAQRTGSVIAWKMVLAITPTPAPDAEEISTYMMEVDGFS